MIEFNWGKYFTKEEFVCSFTKKCEMDQEFIDKLNKLREDFNKPLTISSGYRDATHPVEAKKRSTSPGAHTTGQACDILVARGDAYKLLALAISSGYTGVGINQKGSSSRFIHLDTLDNSAERPRPTIWSY